MLLRIGSPHVDGRVRGVDPREIGEAREVRESATSCPAIANGCTLIEDSVGEERPPSPSPSASGSASKPKSISLPMSMPMSMPRPRLMDGAERIQAVMGEQGVLGVDAILGASREGVVADADADSDSGSVAVAVVDPMRNAVFSCLPLLSRSTRLCWTGATILPDCKMVLGGRSIWAMNLLLASDTGLSAAASSARPTGLRWEILLGEVRGMGSLVGVP